MPRHATGRRPKPDPNATAYIFKVALTDNKTIWRRVGIRSDQTLDDLHAIIFTAFDRFEEHLYSFFRTPPWLRRRAAGGDDTEYTSPNMIDEADPLDGHEVYDASKTSIGSLGLKVGDKLYYLFDFGDSWFHELTVEGVGSPLESKRRYPFVAELHSPSPPQYPEVEE